MDTKQNNLPVTLDDIPQTIKAPEQLKEPAIVGRPTQYTQKIGQDILIDVATTAVPVAKIAASHGITERTLYYWMMQNEQFFQAYTRALEHRAVVMAGDITSDIAKLERICDNEGHDPRWQNVQTGCFDRKWRHLEWMMSKFNRKLFGDKLDMSGDMTISNVDSREAAWQLIQQAKATTYTDISTQPGAQSQ